MRTLTALTTQLLCASAFCDETAIKVPQGSGVFPSVEQVDCLEELVGGRRGWQTVARCQTPAQPSRPARWPRKRAECPRRPARSAEEGLVPAAARVAGIHVRLILEH